MTSPSANVTYRVYAHRFYNRLLVTEISVQRLGPTGTPLTITRTPLTTDMDSNDLALNDTESYTDMTSGCGQTPDITCRLAPY